MDTNKIMKDLRKVEVSQEEIMKLLLKMSKQLNNRRMNK